jgi:O-antigen/teichoic acid export membrane protein
MKPDFQLFLEARHLWMIASLNYLAQWIGVIAAIIFLDEIDIAALNAIFRLLAPLQFISLTIDFYFAPRYALANGSELLRLRNLGRFLGLTLAIPYCLVVFIYSDLLIDFLYRDIGGSSVDLIKIVIITGLIQIAFGSNGMLLQMKCLDKYVKFGVLLRMFTYIAAISFISSTMSLAGLVMGFSISVIAQAAYNSRQVKKNYYAQLRE